MSSINTERAENLSTTHQVPLPIVKWILGSTHAKVVPPGVLMTTVLISAVIERGQDGYGGKPPPKMKVEYTNLSNMIKALANENTDSKKLNYIQF